MGVLILFNLSCTFRISIANIAIFVSAQTKVQEAIASRAKKEREGNGRDSCSA
jgi:hypothetical protein